MPPRTTTDFGALFESLIEDLRIQVAASVDRTMSDFAKRLSRIERRLDQLDPEHAVSVATADRIPRNCSLCPREVVARGLCSAHYQQWRYRERKSKQARHARGINDMTAGSDLLTAAHSIPPHELNQSFTVAGGALERCDN